MSNYTFIKKFIDKEIISNRYENLDNIYINFSNIIKNFDDSQFCDLLLYCGFIPDLYDPDSSEETLFSKLVEIMVSEWALRMGFKSIPIKQKASYEDVVITINSNIIVCDVKTFRLGRSQQAPNVKDFIKLEDIRKWLKRHKSPLGGLVIYPDTHEWTKGSDVYQYCSTKEVPTVMLPYKYLALLLKYKKCYNTNNLKSLWNYNKLFPNYLPKNMPNGNKTAYWNIINNEILNITNIDNKIFEKNINEYNEKTKRYILFILRYLNLRKHIIIKKINNDINSLSDTQVRKELSNYKIEQETSAITTLIKRIKLFRLETSD